jgi:hypothetical protein
LTGLTIIILSRSAPLVSVIVFIPMSIHLSLVYISQEYSNKYGRILLLLAVVNKLSISREITIICTVLQII